MIRIYIERNVYNMYWKLALFSLDPHDGAMITITCQQFILYLHFNIAKPYQKLYSSAHVFTHNQSIWHSRLYGNCISDFSRRIWLANVITVGVLSTESAGILHDEIRSLKYENEQYYGIHDMFGRNFKCYFPFDAYKWIIHTNNNALHSGMF